MATRVVTVNDILDGHVGLDLECFDRIYLNGWVHNLQVPGQVVSFLTRHLGFPIPSPAILEKIGLRFRKEVIEYAGEGDIPVIRFAKGDRKLDVMRPYLDRLVREDRTGVAAIGVAQEFQRVFTGTTYHSDPDGGGIPRFGYAKADRRVTAYYFYLVDEVFGPAFVKVCAYFPYPIKNGSTDTSTPNAPPPPRGSGSPSWTTGSPPPTTRPGCNASATPWDPPRSGCSPSAGGRGCRRALTEADRAAGYWPRSFTLMRRPVII